MAKISFPKKYKGGMTEEEMKKIEALKKEEENKKLEALKKEEDKKKLEALIKKRNDEKNMKYQQDVRKIIEKGKANNNIKIVQPQPQELKKQVEKPVQRIYSDRYTSGLGSRTNLSSSSKENKRNNTTYENIQEIIAKTIDVFKQFVEKNANKYSISDFIVLNPKTTTNIPPLKKDSFSYMVLYAVILFVFSVIPAVITGLTIYYFISLMNISKWFKKKMFYGDNVSYKNVDNLYHIFRRFYLNDYTFYVIIVCIAYIAAVIYMSFSSYVNNSNESFRKYNYSVYVFIGMCLAIIAIHITIYYNFIQHVGKLRDRINNTVYNHVNLDYVDYLISLDGENSKCKEECEMKLPTGMSIKICSCKSSLIELNSLDNLEGYLRTVLTELESKVAPADINQVSLTSFKTYKNEKGLLYYDLILDSIMTFYLLLNFANTKYDITIDKSFLKNRTPIINTINDSTNILYDFASMKCTAGGDTIRTCLNRDIDGQNNMSKYMMSICEEVQNLVQGVRTDIGKLKNKMGTLTVSIQFWAIILTLIACIIYYASFT
jgi:hypothetical protein